MEHTLTAADFASVVARAADEAQIRPGGRVTLTPYYRCWDVKPTERQPARRALTERDAG